MGTTRWYHVALSLSLTISIVIMAVIAWHRQTRVRELERDVERKRLEHEQVTVGHQKDRAALERDLEKAVRASSTLQRQLDAVRRAAPGARAESVLHTRTGTITVPVVDSETASGSGSSTGGQGGAAPETPDGVAALIRVSNSEIRLTTKAGNVAVLGETLVECVGGSCPLGWSHVEPWSVDATSLIMREQQRDPRWMVGALIGIDDIARIRYGAIAARKVARVRDVELHVLGLGMFGGGDAIAAAGLGVTW